MTFDDLLKQLASDDTTLASDDTAIATATQTLSDANKALAAANSKKTADTAQRQTDDTAISAAIAATGPRFVGPKIDGSIDVYLGNADGNGYHIVNVKPSSGSVDPVPAPTPAPAPVP